MVKEATYLDTIHDAHRDLLGVKSRLDDISSALRTIGLKELGYDLNEMASIISGSVKVVNGAISLQLNDRVRADEQATTNMVNGMCSMLAMRTPGKNY